MCKFIEYVNLNICLMKIVGMMIDSEYIILYGDHFSRIPLYTYISFNRPVTRKSGVYSKVNVPSFKLRTSSDVT